MNSGCCPGVCGTPAFPRLPPNTGAPRSSAFAHTSAGAAMVVGCGLWVAGQALPSFWAGPAHTALNLGAGCGCRHVCVSPIWIDGGKGQWMSRHCFAGLMPHACSADLGNVPEAAQTTHAARRTKQVYSECSGSASRGRQTIVGADCRIRRSLVLVGRSRPPKVARIAVPKPPPIRPDGRAKK